MKITQFASVLLIAGASSAFAGGAIAQTAAQTAQTAQTARGAVSGKDVMASKSLSTEDRDFMVRAAGIGLFEIEASKLAAKKSQNPAIRRYAAMVVRDHVAAKEELKTIAVAKPLRIPEDMPDGRKAQLDMLLKSTPAEFDQKYVKLVAIENHEADIKLFEQQVENGKDPQVKAFAARMLPKLKMHLAAAGKLGA